MKSSGTDETCPIALMSRSGGSIGGIIKRIANEYGFLWRELPDFPLARNAAIVLVAATGDEKMFSVLFDKCGVWDEKEQTACACCYELEVGNGVYDAMPDKESLTDWILTEYDFYGQTEIGFEGADGLSAEQLQEFETVLERALKELIKNG
ncbi:MAG: hypothetical protein ACI4Q3_03120 [Kiritimatiellia bacterium]